MRIVIVCTGNTCRSPMAEALMRRALARRGIQAEVCSAGVSAFAGDGASAEAVREMAERGLDISGHRAQNVRDVALSGALVLCMTESHLMAVRRIAPDADAHTLMGYAGLRGCVPDPMGMGQEQYSRAAAQMQRAIDIIADRMIP